MAQPNVAQNNLEPFLLGFNNLNAVPETIAQDTSSIMTMGTVLGRANISQGPAAAISTSGAGNTGNGTITMDTNLPCQPGARAGVYTVFLTGATAGYVTGPDGVQIGAAFTSLPNPWTQQLKFVIAAGGTAFVNGDKFTITVPGIVQSNGAHAGSGVITMDATTPVLANAKAGLYTITFTGAAAGYITDPFGMQLGAAFTSLPNPWNNELKFVISGTPSANDVSYIFITAGTGKLKRFVSTNSDGSQLPEYITAQPFDATAGDVLAPIGTLVASGHINKDQIVLQGESLQTFIPGLNTRVQDALRDTGFVLESVAPLSAFDN